MIPVKPPGWLETAIKVREFHVNCLRANKKHRMTDTAIALNRGLSSVSNYLKIASWHKTHPRHIEKCETINDCLELIKKLELERELS